MTTSWFILTHVQAYLLLMLFCCAISCKVCAYKVYISCIRITDSLNVLWHLHIAFTRSQPNINSVPNIHKSKCVKSLSVHTLYSLLVIILISAFGYTRAPAATLSTGNRYQSKFVNILGLCLHLHDNGSFNRGLGLPHRIKYICLSCSDPIVLQQIRKFEKWQKGVLIAYTKITFVLRKPIELKVWIVDEIANTSDPLFRLNTVLVGTKQQ